MLGAILLEHLVSLEDVRVARDGVQGIVLGLNAFDHREHVVLRVDAVVDLQGGSANLRRLALQRFDPRPPRHTDGFAQHAGGHAYADHRRLERALLLQVAIRNRARVILIAAHCSRVDHGGVAAQAIADGAGDHRGHGHRLEPHVFGRNRHASGHLVQRGRLKLTDRAHTPVDDVHQLGAHGVMGHGLELDFDARLGFEM
mmetsp:Transcript_13985/g.41550  ORF Transcript_13985/g.41550 Transcript_13985/m.41550 type:complete len:200 (-) Transcript_13985:1051-1650(-)